MWRIGESLLVTTDSCGPGLIGAAALTGAMRTSGLGDEVSVTVVRCVGADVSCATGSLVEDFDLLDVVLVLLLFDSDGASGGGLVAELSFVDNLVRELVVTSAGGGFETELSRTSGVLLGSLSVETVAPVSREMGEPTRVELLTGERPVSTWDEPEAGAASELFCALEIRSDLGAIRSS